MTICPRCKGDGSEPSNPILAVVTLGLWPPADKVPLPASCRRCDGYGYVVRTRRCFG